MRKKSVFCLVIAACCLASSIASAESLGTCDLTGYTFMGGGIVYTNPAKDYLLTSNADRDGTLWGMGWLKFTDLPTVAVSEAWLSMECYTDMNGTLTSANPMDVTIYAVDADVASIITAADVQDFKENHVVGSDVASATLTGAGVYSWEITSLVNGWIAGDNYGLVVAGWDDVPGTYMTHPYFGGLPDGGASTSVAPTLATAPVPEPSTLAMLVGLGLLGMVGVRRKR